MCSFCSCLHAPTPSEQVCALKFCESPREIFSERYETHRRPGCTRYLSVLIYEILPEEFPLLLLFLLLTVYFYVHPITHPLEEKDCKSAYAAPLSQQRTPDAFLRMHIVHADNSEFSGVPADQIAHSPQEKVCIRRRRFPSRRGS